MKSTLKFVLQLCIGLFLSGWGGLTGVTVALAKPPAAPIPAPYRDGSAPTTGYTSADGRFILYGTKEYTPLAGETVLRLNVFVYNRATGDSIRISLQPDGTPYNDWMRPYSISGNGRFVLYGYYNVIYLHDRDPDQNGIYDEPGAGATSTIQMQMNAPYEPGSCVIPAEGGEISTNGEDVVFPACYDTGRGPYSGRVGLFIYRTTDGTTRKITDGLYPGMSGDGRYVIYVRSVPSSDPSEASRFQLFRWDRDPDKNGIFDDVTADPQLASVSTGGKIGNCDVSLSPIHQISEDGRFVGFCSSSDNLTPDDINESSDAFVHDFSNGQTSLISVSNDGYPLNADSCISAISDDGRFVTFSSESDAVVDGDDNEASDTFLRDRTLGTTTLVTGKANDNLDVYISERANLDLTISGLSQGGLDREVSFTATLSTKSGVKADSFTWQISDHADIVHTVTSQVTDQVSVQWGSPGEKTIQVTATTTDGSVSTTKIYQVYAPPVADFQTEITSISNYYKAAFTNTSSGAYSEAFWDYGDEYGGETPEEYYDAKGVYTVSLTVTGPGGTDIIRKTIEIGGDSTPAAAQPLIHSDRLGFPEGSYRSSAWGDFDQDGAPDLLVSGCYHMGKYNSGECDTPFVKIYRNKHGLFTDLHAGFMPQDGYAQWVDYDQDGLLDVAVSGYAPGDRTASIVIYRNLGNGHFIRIPASLPRTSDPASVTWVDTDQDGAPDVIVNNKIYKNYAGAFYDTHVAFPVWGASDWADFDHDGDLDLLTTAKPDQSPKTSLYRNDGGSFTEVATGLPDVRGGTVSWVDDDQDGDLDVLIGGWNGTADITRLYRNQAGVFTDSLLNLPAVSGPIHWADFDHDGDLDLLLSYRLFRNTGDGFTDVLMKNYSSTFNASAWVDYNQDGILDLARSFGEPYSDRIYGGQFFLQNASLIVNPPPSTPVGLTSSVVGNQVTLDWDPASEVDDLTPNAALTYNLCLSVDPDGIDALFPNPGIGPGNTGEETRLILRNLPSGKTYYWGIQAVDAGLSTSSFTAVQSFAIPAADLTNLDIQSDISVETPGFPDQEYTFTASLVPLNAVLPVTYTWSATGYADVVHADTPRPIDSAAFSWTDSGEKTITVTASNSEGTISQTLTVGISNIPRPAFSASKTVGAAPAQISFTDQSLGDVTSRSWDFGDGGTDTGQYPIHTYENPGTYTVTLTVTGPEGTKTLVKADFIRIYQPVLAGISVSPGTTGTAPLVVSFSNSGTGDVASLLWDFGDGVTSTDTNPSHTYATGGYYDVWLHVTGMGGDTSYTSKGISVHPASQAAFHTDVTTGAAPLTVHFINDSTGDFTSTTWYFGDGLTSSETNPVHTYTSPGLYYAQMVVTGPTGTDPSDDNVDIRVYRPVHAGFTLSPASSGIAPFSINCINSITGDFSLNSVQWDYGDGITSHSYFGSHIYTTPGTYTVTQTVTGSGGDTSTATHTITVYAPSHADFHVDPVSGPASLTVQFSNDSTGDFTSSSWNFGDGTTSSETNPEHTYSQVGTYSVQLTISGLGGESTLVRLVDIQVNDPVQSGFTANILSGPIPLTVQFTNTSTGDYTSCLWDFGDGSTSAEANPIHQYLQAGTYTVQLTVSGPGGTDTLIRHHYIVAVQTDSSGIYLPMIVR